METRKKRSHKNEEVKRSEKNTKKKTYKNKDALSFLDDPDIKHSKYKSKLKKKNNKKNNKKNKKKINKDVRNAKQKENKLDKKTISFKKNKEVTKKRKRSTSSDVYYPKEYFSNKMENQDWSFLDYLEGPTTKKRNKNNISHYEDYSSSQSSDTFDYLPNKYEKSKNTEIEILEISTSDEEITKNIVQETPVIVNSNPLQSNDNDIVFPIKPIRNISKQEKTIKVMEPNLVSDASFSFATVYSFFRKPNQEVKQTLPVNVGPVPKKVKNMNAIVQEVDYNFYTNYHDVHQKDCEEIGSEYYPFKEDLQKEDPFDNFGNVILGDEVFNLRK